MWIEFVPWRTDTSSGHRIEDEAARAIAHAAALGVDNEPKFTWTWYTITILIKCVARRTDAIFILIQDESSAWRTSLDRCTFN